MPLEFGKMKHSEIRDAALLATRAFDDYEYFTNWFPEKEERNRIQFAIIWREYKTNFGPAKYIVARQDGKLVAVAQLNPPTYKKPSDFRYILHGWLKVYREGDRKRIDEWLAMDAAAGAPCHAYQKTSPGIWYASSLTVDPSVQENNVSFDDVISSRRSVRSYDASKTISESEVRSVIAAAQEAPSWTNSQPSRYYVALSPEKVQEVREVIGEWNKRNTKGVSATKTRGLWERLTFINN